MTSTITLNPSLTEKESKGHARQMGKIENYFASLKRQDMFNNFCVISRFESQITNELLYLFVKGLIVKYPILMCVTNATDHSKADTPSPRDHIMVKDLIEFTDIVIELPAAIMDLYHGSGNNMRNPDLLQRLNDVEIPYGDASLTWRLARLDDHTVVYLSNHCLSDGVSGKNMTISLSEFLSTNTSSTNSADATSVDLNEPLFQYQTQSTELKHLPPAIDSLVNFTPPLSYLPEFVFNTLVINKLSHKHPELSSREQKHVYKLVNISSERLSEIKKILSSQSQRITINSLIHTLWRTAQYQHVLQFNNSFLKLSDTAVPCDARRYVKEQASTTDAAAGDAAANSKDHLKFGSNVSGVHKYHHPINNLTWNWITYENSLFQGYIQNKRPLYPFGILTSDLITQRKSLDQVLTEASVGVQRQGTLMSNVGLVKGHGIKDTVFSQNSEMNFSSVCLSIVGTENSGVNIVIAMCEGWTTDEKFNAMVKYFEELLNDFELRI
ncbi:hypothetical protein WICPIJ_009386 [Wickerhamomyces pijperi]|uniref:Alcohol acetyltransferase n=1 Tax=Wickerhamomyces pijperi TaxID=599730 RepID=A0A9P8PP14_WICPI|nr:hypothetical protein WICPIJ_009386 [Wickerhamomyces pijperi]